MEPELAPEAERQTRVIVEVGTEAAPVVVRWCTRRGQDFIDPQLPMRPGAVGVYDSYALRTPGSSIRSGRRRPPRRGCGP